MLSEIVVKRSDFASYVPIPAKSWSKRKLHEEAFAFTSFFPSVIAQKKRVKTVNDDFGNLHGLSHYCSTYGYVHSKFVSFEKKRHYMEGATRIPRKFSQTCAQKVNIYVICLLLHLVAPARMMKEYLRNDVVYVLQDLTLKSDHVLWGKMRE